MKTVQEILGKWKLLKFLDSMIPDFENFFGKMETTKIFRLDDS